MKRNVIVLALAAAAVILTGCRKEVSVLNGAEQPLLLSPVAKSVTKAAIDGTTFPSDRTIILSAYYNAASGDNGNFFSKITFEKSGTTWKENKYWPLSGTLDFLGYSADGLTLSNITYATNVSKAVEFDVPDNSSVQSDILFAAADEQVYNASGTAMSFDHAEASIAFTAKSNVAIDTTKNNGVTIEKIVLNNAKYSGHVKLNDDGTCVWSSLASQKNVDLPGISSGYDVPTTAIDIATTHFGIGNTGIILPAQSATSFTVYYTLHNGKDGDGANLDNIGLQYVYTCSGDWVYGKKYIYALNITLNGIEVSPSVVDWSNEEPEEVDIPKKVVATYAMKAPAMTLMSLPKVKMAASSRMGVCANRGVFTVTAIP